MDLIEHTLTTRWQHRVAFTDHVFDSRNPVLRQLLTVLGDYKHHQVLVVLDQFLAAAQPGLAGSVQDYFSFHPDGLELACSPVILPGGEGAKNTWSHVLEIHTLIHQLHLDRHSFLIAVGGGGLLDMAGFAATTAHRGIRHVRIPSTTLSQCDSGVGVKNGINAFGKKNFIGTFCPPWAVINDFQLLATLAARDRRAGCAEAVKIACIRDLAFFEILEKSANRLKSFEPESMRWMIRRCAELHLAHIATSGDPFESGSARPLDFGHWAAHKLEQLSQFRLGHGEAVAIGIALDVVYSQRMGYLDQSSAERVLSLLEALGFVLFAPELVRLSPERKWLILDGLDEFREHLGGKLSITLLRGVGAGFEVFAMDLPQVLESIQELRVRPGRREGSSL